MPKPIKRGRKKPTKSEVLNEKFGITRSEVDKVIKLRAEKVSWAEIMEQMGKSVPWVHTIRPIMKQLDPSVVQKSYDRGTPKAPRHPKERREVRDKSDREKSIKVAKTKAGRSALVEEIWNLDTPDARVREILDGRTMTVAYDLDGIKMAPFDLRIKIIKSIKEAKSGKVVDFLDTDQKYHAVNFRYITDIR